MAWAMMAPPGRGMHKIPSTTTTATKKIFTHNCLNFPRGIPKIVLPLDNRSPDNFPFTFLVCFVFDHDPSARVRVRYCTLYYFFMHFYAAQSKPSQRRLARERA